MTNKEIIVEELKKHFESLLGNYTGWEFIASSLLSKLSLISEEEGITIAEGEVKWSNVCGYYIDGKGALKIGFRASPDLENLENKKVKIIIKEELINAI